MTFMIPYLDDTVFETGVMFKKEALHCFFITTPKPTLESPSFLKSPEKQKRGGEGYGFARQERIGAGNYYKGCG